MKIVPEDLAIDSGAVISTHKALVDLVSLTPSEHKHGSSWVVWKLFQTKVSVYFTGPGKAAWRMAGSY